MRDAVMSGSCARHCCVKSYIDLRPVCVPYMCGINYKFSRMAYDTNNSSLVWN